MSDDLVKQLRERSRQYVENEYNFDKRAADYIELLEYHLRCDKTWQPYSQKLKAALREITSVSKVYAANSEDMARALTTLLASHRKIALAALEGKDEKSRG